MTNHTQFPDHYALAFPCKRAAALIYTALEVLGPEDAPDHDATAVEHLRLALLILGRPRDWLHPGGDLTLRAPSPDQAVLCPSKEPLARPSTRAAALVFTSLSLLGEYPADAPDYDLPAVEHLRLALALLAPGFGDLKILGAPRPVKRPPPPPIAALRGLAREALSTLLRSVLRAGGRLARRARGA